MEDKPFTYPVAEIFQSVQFEGWRSGNPATFVRLSGCNLNCPFCDTDHTPKENLTPFEICTMVSRGAPGSPEVIITGGEPTIHNLRPLVMELKVRGFLVSVETNGLRLPSLVPLLEGGPKGRLIDWVTVSPKVPVLRDHLLRWADEVKYVVPVNEGLVYWEHPRVALQPEWGKEGAVDRCIELARKHIAEGARVKVSIQTHNYLGLR